MSLKGDWSLKFHAGCHEVLIDIATLLALKFSSLYSFTLTC